MNFFDYNPTTRVVFGPGSISQFADIVRNLASNRVLLVTDPGIIATGNVERAAGLLKSSGVSTQIFEGVEENPTTRHVEMGLDVAKDFKPDLIIGFGGGSAMDCAKGINFLFTNGGRMEDYWGVGKATKPMLPSVGVPTTAGTGSEAQAFALICQEETHIKMACGDIKARFKVAILDPELVQTAPKQVRITTGIDAISHAIESFVCTRRNPVSQMFAKEAWRLLSQNYERSLADNPDVAVLGDMLLGAHFSGAAIENSMLGLAHACANPLTARFNVIHGAAVGLMLPHVVRFNGQSVNGVYADLLEETNGRSKHSASVLAERLDDFLALTGLGTRLRDFGVAEQDLPVLAQEAAEQWTAKFNPRVADGKEILGLYVNAY